MRYRMAADKSSALPTTLQYVLLGVFLFASTACSGLGGSSDIRAAEEFDEFPLYWLGAEFEGMDLTHVGFHGPGGFVTLVYGSCTPVGTDEPSCSPPLQIQVSPLCKNLEAVARAPIWRRRSMRGAPVGAIDSAPVLLSRRVQVKVYRGEGSDPGLPWRTLSALRSANQVAPVIRPGDRIPPPAPGVLAGTRACAAK
jgi:hypothetical protein